MLAQNVSFYIKFIVSHVIVQNRRRNVSKMASSRLKDVSEDDITSLRKDPGIVLAVFLKIHLNLRSWFCCISFFELDGCTTFNRLHFVLIDQFIRGTNLFRHNV